MRFEVGIFYRAKPDLRRSGSGTGHYHGHYSLLYSLQRRSEPICFQRVMKHCMYTLSCYQWVWSLGTNAFRHRLIGLPNQSALKRCTCPYVLLPVRPEGRGEVSQTAKLNFITHTGGMVAAEES